MLPLRRLTRESWPEPDVNSLRTRLPVYNGVLPLLLFMLFPSPSMRSLLMLSTGHQKAQAGNAAKACRNYAGKATTVPFSLLPSGSCVAQAHISCGRVHVLFFPAFQFCLSCGEEGSGSGGCSVATAQWGCRD